MRKYYISKNYSAKFTASSKAKIDCEIIAEKNHYKNLGLRRNTLSNNLLGRSYTLVSIILGLIRMPFSSMLLLQYPTNLIKFMLFIARVKKTKTITIIHDLDSLRGSPVENEISLLSKSSIVIAHNEEMINFVQKKGMKNKLISLDLFDYLMSEPKEEITCPPIKSAIEIVFAGNLAKSAFLKHIGQVKSTITVFKLYGIGFEYIKNNCPKNIIYKGFYSPNELVKFISGTFGLVWDGDSIETCSGTAGKYLKYNNPHKMSLYLLSGLPVLVWSRSASARFVLSNKLGFAIDSLQDITTLEQTLAIDEYQLMLDNVRIIQKKIATGHFLTEALRVSENTLSSWN
ncbi:MAG: galactofuranosyltransferase [Bacteroidales bacterium]|nr:galactofuranosyltransferase [Bacteroidales bacterium]